MRKGPDMGIPSGSELYETIARHWKDSSLLMKGLCDANGMTYLHFLQPNQYFDTGRPLTDEEQANAFDEDHAYRPGVVEGYPYLLSEAPALVAQGVDFHDLTGIYDEHLETIYIDDCCHPNAQGYEIVAETVAAGIVKALNGNARLLPDSSGKSSSRTLTTGGRLNRDDATEMNRSAPAPD